jgi:hypothetical protein
LNKTGVVARSTRSGLTEDLASASALSAVARKSAVSPVGVFSVDTVDDGFLALKELRIPVAARNAAFTLTVVRARLACAISVFVEALGASFAVGLVEVLGADNFLARGDPLALVGEELASVAVLVVARTFHTLLGGEAIRESPDAAIILQALLFGGEVAELLEAEVVGCQDTLSVDGALGLLKRSDRSSFEGGVVVNALSFASSTIAPATVLLLNAGKFVVVETALSSALEGLSNGDPAHGVGLVDRAAIVSSLLADFCAQSSRWVHHAERIGVALSLGWQVVASVVTASIGVIEHADCGIGNTSELVARAAEHFSASSSAFVPAANRISDASGASVVTEVTRAHALTGFFFPEASGVDGRIGDLTAVTDGEVVLAIVDTNTNTTDDVPDTLRIADTRTFGVVLDGALVLAATRLERRSEPIAGGVAADAIGLTDDGGTRLGTLVVNSGPEAVRIGIAKLVVGVTDAAALSANAVVHPLAV